MPGNITAIIVTFNRKVLLMQCLEAVVEQTRVPDHILIVDNTSTDGTRDLLDETGWLAREHVKYLALPSNVGGAGGFAVGIEHALASGAKWLWTMDDDGYPERNCLQRLFDIVQARGLDSVSPVHLDIQDKTELSFRTMDKRGRKLSEPPNTDSEKNLFIPGQANLFNGWLVNASLVQQIGLPRVELFIRGDEVEYLRRMRRHGVPFGMLMSARFYHPSDRDERLQFLCGLGRARDAKNDFKNYYMYRNKALAFRENHQLWLLPFDFGRYFYYFIIYKKFDWKGFRLWLKATRDGLLRKLGRHPNY